MESHPSTPIQRRHTLAEYRTLDHPDLPDYRVQAHHQSRRIVHWQDCRWPLGIERDTIGKGAGGGTGRKADIVDVVFTRFAFPGETEVALEIVVTALAKGGAIDLDRVDGVGDGSHEDGRGELHVFVPLRVLFWIVVGRSIRRCEAGNHDREGSDNDNSAGENVGETRFTSR